MVFCEFIHGLLKLFHVSNGCGTVRIQHQNPLPTGTQTTLKVAYIHHSKCVAENAKIYKHTESSLYPCRYHWSLCTIQ